MTVCLSKLFAGVALALVPAMLASPSVDGAGSSRPNNPPRPSIALMEVPGTPAPGVVLTFSGETSSAAIHVPLGADERAAISPGSSLAVILKSSLPNTNTAVARIFNEVGLEVRQMLVAPLDHVAISDDGRLAVFGGLPTADIAAWSMLAFYDSSGQAVVIPDRRFGPEVVGTFSPSGDYFAFLASNAAQFTNPRGVTLLVFDRTFQEVGKHNFDDWPLSSALRPPIINEGRHEITLVRATGGPTTAEREILVLGLDGELKTVEKEAQQ